MLRNYWQMINELLYKKIKIDTDAADATLVAVSKYKPKEDIEALHNLGQLHFGENYVQELVDKQAALPTDIYWHFIGHLQTNKVKYIAPFIYLIQSVDSEKLLQEIEKQGAKNNKVIKVLLQVHIADEATKFGFNEAELLALQINPLKHTEVIGLMGMATFTPDKNKVKTEFEYLKSLYKKFAIQNNISLTTLSMGMSDDYALALQCGSNMVRIGSAIFGSR